MNYLLIEACQNTFILCDQLDQVSVNEEFLDAAHFCLEEEGRDDALILVNGQVKGSAFYAQMVVLGLDGKLGEFCGNGARACAAYLFDAYPGFEEYYLVTKCGAHLLIECKDGEYAIQLPLPTFDLNGTFVIGSNLFGCTYVEAIEPHLTLEKNMTDQELEALGTALNKKVDIFPKGINVNAWHEIEENLLFVKTYERGVQRLTAACGSGALSCSYAYKKEGCFTILTPGGKLEVMLDHEGAILKGPASFS